jgi:hypothetical protein
LELQADTQQCKVCEVLGGYLGAGDTGLLDHLLKHLADKTVSPEGDKLRRRHNAEGHMEYWLQSAAAAQSGIPRPHSAEAH